MDEDKEFLVIRATAGNGLETVNRHQFYTERGRMK